MSSTTQQPTESAPSQDSDAFPAEPAQGNEELAGAATPEEGGSQPADSGGEAGEAGGGAAQPAKSPGTPAWAQRRIDELTRQRYDAERKAQEYEARLRALEQPAEQASGYDGAPASPQGRGESDADFEARVQRAVAERQFAQRCDNLVLKGRGDFNDFDERMKQWGALGGIPPALVEAVMEADEAGGHRILYDLAGNLDEAYRISQLTPAQMGAAVARKAASGRAPAPRVSSAPDPAPRAAGLGGPQEKDPDSMTTDEWMAWRDKMERARAGA